MKTLGLEERADRMAAAAQGLRDANVAVGHARGRMKPSARIQAGFSPSRA